MKLFRKAKDGGPKSTVTGYWLIEWKRLFSVVLLRFDHGSRDEYHDHAFNSLNWVIRGSVLQQIIGGAKRVFLPSFWPILTRRSTFHRVISEGTTWVFSIRGPWRDTWHEYDPLTRKYTTLTHGRREV